MNCIIKEVMRVWESRRERVRAFHLFTNNLCLSSLMEIINADPQGPSARHTAVCVLPNLSLYIYALSQFLLSLSLSVIHFLPGRERDQWQVSGIDATLR